MAARVVSARNPTLGSRHIHASFAVTSVLTGVVFSAIFVLDPFLGVGLGVGGLAVVLAIEPKRRLAMVVVGWMATFGYSADLSAAKFAFVGFGAIVGIMSTVNLSRMSMVGKRGPIPAVMGVACALGVVSFVAYAVGVAGGADPIDAGRDSAVYVLFSVTIPIAVEAGFVLRRTTIVRLIVACGLLSAISFFVTNTSARGVNEFTAFTPWLGSLLLVIPAASIAFAQALYSRGLVRVLWLFCFLLITGLVLASGTRTGLVLFATALTMCLVPATNHSRRTAAVAMLTVSMGAIYVSLVTIVSRFVDGDFIAKRLGFLLDFNIDRLTVDQSALARFERYDRALSYFQGQPLLGKGFGTITAYERVDADQAVSFYLDTPLLIPAKFGVVGTGIVVVCVLILAHTSVDWRKGTRLTVDQLIVVGFIAASLAALPLSAVLEDKGYILGLCLVLAFGLAGRRKLGESGREVFGPRVDDAACSAPDTPPPISVS